MKKYLLISLTLQLFSFYFFKPIRNIIIAPKDSVLSKKLHFLNVELLQDKPQKIILKQKMRMIQGESKKENSQKENKKKRNEKSESVLVSNEVEFKPQPIYPIQAKNEKLTGSLLLELMTDQEGFVESIVIQKSSGHEVLDNEAVKTLKTWRLSPLSRVIVPVEFQLQ